jgi:hypothetical protein
LHHEALWRRSTMSHAIVGECMHLLATYRPGFGMSIGPLGASSGAAADPMPREPKGSASSACPADIIPGVYERRPKPCGKEGLIVNRMI